MFYLVSGGPASGKTSIVKLLQLDGVEVHEADEKRAVTAEQRCTQLEEWVNDALVLQEKGVDFLLATASPLGELLACPSATKLNGIAACLLDCHDHTRITRMRDRGIIPRWPPSQDVVSWAAWHRMHAWDPQWESRVIEEHAPDGHDHSRWTSWAQTDPRWSVKIIDTTKIKLDQVVELVANWVTSEQSNTPRLSNKTNWWK